MGCRDVAGRHYRKARDPAYRRQHQVEYDNDISRYGKELTLDKANELLSLAGKEIGEFLGTQGKGNGNQSASPEMIIDTRWDNDNPTEKRLIPRQIAENTTIGDYLELSKAATLLYAEKYPTIRLWFHWKEYVMGGVPDGVDDNFVYEFRPTTRTDDGREELEKQAMRQARLYAYIFKRPEIRVQIAQIRLPRGALPIKAKELPKPDVTTKTEHVTDESAIALLTDFDYAYRYL